MDAEAPTLFGLLARCWQTDAPVTALAFANDGTSVAFAGADGSVSIAPLADADPPTKRYRVAADTGRATISPRRKPPRPLSRSNPGDAALLLAPFGEKEFLAGGLGGKLVVVGPRAEIVPIAREPAPIEALATLPGRGVIVAEGGRLSLYRTERGTPTMLAEANGYVTNVAAAGKDGLIAWADGAGLHIASADDPTEIVSDQRLAAREVTGLAWSPRAQHLAVALGAEGIALLRLDTGCVRQTTFLPDYPAPVQSMAWAMKTDVLVTSGAFRIIAWDVAAQDGGLNARPTALPTGRAGFVAVETVAMHPGRPLVAAGYANGAIIVTPVGQSDELVVREAGAGAPVAMQWSADGQHLAFGTREGEAAIVTFPPNLFK